MMIELWRGVRLLDANDDNPRSHGLKRLSLSAAYSSLLSQIVQKALENGDLEQLAATVGNLLQNHQVPRAGFDTSRKSQGNSAKSPNGAGLGAGIMEKTETNLA